MIESRKLKIDEKNILRKIIELYEKQEGIKITYKILMKGESK